MLETRIQTPAFSAETLHLECTPHGSKTPLTTGKRLGGKGGGAYEVKRRSVCLPISEVVLGCQSFVLAWSFHLVSKKHYNQKIKQLEKTAVENAEKLMCEAEERLHNLLSNENADNMEEIGDYTVVKAAVSIDETWQKRRHSSKIGAVFAVSVRTGEIQD